MYYTSTNKADLEAYNAKVTESQNYQGTTKRWSEVITHKDGGQFAILKHEVHTSETLKELASLDGWFEIDIV